MSTIATSPEQEYFRDAHVLVTDQRAVIGSMSIPLAKITAVECSRLPREWRPALVMAVMVIGMAWCVYEYGLVVMGIVVSLFLTLTLILLSATKPEYTVNLTLASQSVTILTSYDRSYIKQVAAALTHAHQAHA